MTALSWIRTAAHATEVTVRTLCVDRAGPVGRRLPQIGDYPRSETTSAAVGDYLSPEVGPKGFPLPSAGSIGYNRSYIFGALNVYNRSIKRSMSLV